MKYNLLIVITLILGGVIGTLPFILSRRRTLSPTVPDYHMITFRGVRMPRSKFHEKIEASLRIALSSDQLLVPLLALKEVGQYATLAFEKEGIKSLYDSVKNHAIDLAKEMEFDSILDTLQHLRMDEGQFLKEFAGVCSQKQAEMAVARRHLLDVIDPELVGYFRRRHDQLT